MPDLSSMKNGMITKDQDGNPITPYSAAGLVTALAPERPPVPVTPTTEVPGVGIVRKRIAADGTLHAKLTDGSDVLLERQTYHDKTHATQQAALEKARGNSDDDNTT